MESHTRTSARPRLPLNRERVLDAAMRLADAQGIESLTMRKLAGALGVEAMSLYNHVASKADLVDAMVDHVVGEIALPARGRWDAAIRECAVSAHEAFLRHPWACSLVVSPTSTLSARSPRLRYMEWLLGRLRAAGFTSELTYHAYHALDSHILGFTLWQLGHAAGAQELAGDRDFADFAATLVPELRTAGYPNLAEHAEQHLEAPKDAGARDFAFALDLILDGLKRARRSERGGGRARAE